MTMPSNRNHISRSIGFVLLSVIALLTKTLFERNVVHGFTTILAPASISGDSTSSSTATTKILLRQQRRIPSSRTTPRSKSIFELFAMKKFDNESDKDYFLRVTAAASDPEAFERMSLNEQQQPTASVTTNETAETKDEGKPGKYVSVEEWEESYQQSKKDGTISWEERVQMEGQKYGDQYKQNEILRRNMKGF